MPLQNPGPQTQIIFCERKAQLQDEFMQAVHDLNLLQRQQVEAVITGDDDFGRFDLLLFEAQESKNRAKYELLAHIEQHGCGQV
jgi:hypothetical protein